MPRFTSENECFPIYVLRNPINGCSNPSEVGLVFPETINLKGHMPRFTLKMNIFLSFFSETPYMSVETIRTGLVFLRQSI